jgi:hypothetical protein
LPGAVLHDEGGIDFILFVLDLAAGHLFELQEETQRDQRSAAKRYENRFLNNDYIAEISRRASDHHPLHNTTLSRSRPCVRPVRVVFESRQAELLSDPYDFRLVHTPRLNFTSHKLRTAKALCARR